MSALLLLLLEPGSMSTLSSTGICVVEVMLVTLVPELRVSALQAACLTDASILRRAGTQRPPCPEALLSRLAHIVSVDIRVETFCRSLTTQVSSHGYVADFICIKNSTSGSGVPLLFFLQLHKCWRVVERSQRLYSDCMHNDRSSVALWTVERTTEASKPR